MIATYFIHTLSKIETIQTRDEYGNPVFETLAENVPARVEYGATGLTTNEMTTIFADARIFIDAGYSVNPGDRVTFDNKIFEITKVLKRYLLGLSEEYIELYVTEMT